MTDYIELERTDDLKDAKILFGPYSLEVKNGKARVPVEIVDELLSPGRGFKPATKKAEEALQARAEPNEKPLGEVSETFHDEKEETQSGSKKSK